MVIPMNSNTILSLLLSVRIAIADDEGGCAAAVDGGGSDRLTFIVALLVAFSTGEE